MWLQRDCACLYVWVVLLQMTSHLSRIMWPYQGKCDVSPWAKDSDCCINLVNLKLRKRFFKYCGLARWMVVYWAISIQHKCEAILHVPTRAGKEKMKNFINLQCAEVVPEDIWIDSRECNGNRVRVRERRIAMNRGDGCAGRGNSFSCQLSNCAAPMWQKSELSGRTAQPPCWAGGEWQAYNVIRHYSLSLMPRHRHSYILQCGAMPVCVRMCVPECVFAGLEALPHLSRISYFIVSLKICRTNEVRTPAGEKQIVTKVWE